MIRITTLDTRHSHDRTPGLPHLHRQLAQYYPPRLRQPDLTDPPSTTAIRVCGTARLTAFVTLRQTVQRDGARPRTVIVITIAEVYSERACALIRSVLRTSGARSRQAAPTARSVTPIGRAARPSLQCNAMACLSQNLAKRLTSTVIIS